MTGPVLPDDMTCITHYMETFRRLTSEASLFFGMIDVDEGSGQGETVVIRLLVVDDHVVVRSGLIALLEGKNDIHIVGDAADGDEAIAKAQELNPDVVLMDFSMPPGKDGLTATAELKKLMPDIAILILTMHDDE